MSSSHQLPRRSCTAAAGSSAPRLIPTWSSASTDNLPGRRKLSENRGRQPGTNTSPCKLTVFNCGFAWGVSTRQLLCAGAFAQSALFSCWNLIFPLSFSWRSCFVWMIVHCCCVVMILRGICRLFGPLYFGLSIPSDTTNRPVD